MSCVLAEGIEKRLDLQPERALRRLRDGQSIRRRDVLLAWKRRSIERQRGEGEAVAIEYEGRGRRVIAIGTQRQRGAHARGLRVERNVELHRLDQPVGRAVIFQADWAGLFGAHLEVTLILWNGGDVFTHIP